MSSKSRLNMLDYNAGDVPTPLFLSLIFTICDVLLFLYHHRQSPTYQPYSA